MNYFRLLMMAVALIACTTGVNAQTLRDKSGNSIGKIESDGTVRDKSGNRLGKVESDGTIRNASGNTIGKAQGVDRRRAGAYFFFNFL